MDCFGQFGIRVVDLKKAIVIESDWVEAGEIVQIEWLNGRRCVGTVDQVIQNQGVFWIFDHALGLRELVFLNETISITAAVGPS